VNSLTDQQLLRDYSGQRSEAAFAELVRRHVDLVYSAALRMVRDAHLAEDVTQAVFFALAQNARQLTDRSVLSGWLHRTAQNLAAKAVRSDVRRRAREQEAAAMNELFATEPDAAWEHIAPHLDAALGELSEGDRDALLLRYFERKSAREIAKTLGTSEDAAQKRVTRAVERLREFFAKRGVTVGTAGLAVVISANAVQAAPVGLAVNISTAVVVAGTTLATTATATAIKTIAMTTLQKTVITATLAVVAGTGIYQAHHVSRLREQNQTLQQQHAEQIQQLQTERDAATNRLASIIDQIANIKGNNAELLKLRGEVGMLRKQTEASDKLQRENRALREAQTDAEKNKPEEAPIHFAKESWTFAGYATPEATLQSVVWAQTKNDLTTFLAGLAPEAQNEMKSALERKPEMASSMMSAINKVKGFTILKKVSLADDQMLLRVRNEMEDGTENIMTSTLKRIEGEWKMQSGRAE
jgi:RNA polymerase sigma factor (sigma-70 family)